MGRGINGERVGVALQAAVAPDLVCVDSGCNRVILVEADDIMEYVEAINSFLRTAQAVARLQIAGRGRIGVTSVMHIPGATANLMSTKSIIRSECGIEIGNLNGQNYFIINCYKNVDINQKTDI